MKKITHILSSLTLSYALAIISITFFYWLFDKFSPDFGEEYVEYSLATVVLPTIVFICSSIFIYKLFKKHFSGNLLYAFFFYCIIPITLMYCASISGFLGLDFFSFEKW